MAVVPLTNDTTMSQSSAPIVLLPIRTQKRAATTLPNFVGLRFSVHNGKTYQDVLITEEMVGRKLGEYVAYVSAMTMASRYTRSEPLLTGYDRTRKRFTYKQSKNK